ncbi:hypothetical protein PG987_005018 [Apiospora arundinis]
MDVDAAAKAAAAAAAMQAAIMAAVHAAITEIWTLYGIGSTLIACRLFVRLKMVGFRGLQPDDYIALWVFVVYTSVSVVGHVLILDAGGKHTSQLSPQDRINLPESDYALFEYGTKLFLLCMAFFYRRLVRGLWSEKLILPLIGGICATFLAGIITVYTTCVPVSKQWQILPDPGPLCVPQNPWVMITVLCLNLATDVCILSLPIPVLARMQTTTFRKIGLVFLFGLGAFTMVAAVLRIVSIFVLKQESAGALWSIREDFIAVVVTQAPMVPPVRAPVLDVGSGPGESHELRSGGQQHSRKAKDPYSLTQLGITQVGGSESQEEMIAEPPNQAEAAAMAAAAAAANENAMHNRNLNQNQNQNPNFSRTLSAPKMRVPPERRVVVQQTVTTSVSPRQQQIDAEDRRRMEQPWEI